MSLLCFFCIMPLSIIFSQYGIGFCLLPSTIVGCLCICVGGVNAYTYTLSPFFLVLKHRTHKSWGTPAEMSTRMGCSAGFPSPNLAGRLRGKREQQLVSITVSPGLLKARCVPEDASLVFTEPSLEVNWWMILPADFIQYLGSGCIVWLLIFSLCVCVRPVSISYVKKSFWQKKKKKFWEEMFCYCILTSTWQLLAFSGYHGKKEAWPQPIKDEKLHLHLL